LCFHNGKNMATKDVVHTFNRHHVEDSPPPAPGFVRDAVRP
jgi:MarR-like DNA-binding transcriptional regulator SgrR of sgrS sRNA